FQGPYGPGGTYNIYRGVTNSATWDRARANSAVSNFSGTPGHLATISSVAENTFITSNTPGDWWIGLTDSGNTSSIDGFNAGALGGHEAGTSTATGSGWVWVTGEPYVDLGLWGGGDPNDWQNGVPGEDATQRRGDGLWNDNSVGPTIEPAQGSTAFPYVIEYE